MYYIECNTLGGLMPYPPWVMEHKKKGMYVNKINESTYRIYRGHAALEKLADEGLVEFIPYKGYDTTLLNFQISIRTS